MNQAMSDDGVEAVRGPVDWDVAASLAGHLASPGPTATRVDLVDLVTTLRAAAGVATAHAARITELAPADGTDPETDPVSLVQVVDRPGWAQANARMLAAMTATVGGKRASTSVRLAGAAQVGGVLALLAGKVLGQFDPFTADERAPHGRLLLVAPNVLQVERALGVEPADFRLWIALHEQTHALQFAAAPWLADHLRAGASALLDDVGDLVPGSLVRGAGHGGDRRRGQGGGPSVADVVRIASRVLSPGPGSDGAGLLDLLSPAQRAQLDEVGAVMSLLEGHADVAMDAVGPSVVPSVRHIRTQFEARRDAGAASHGLERVLRRLLGLDAKLAQYRDGAAFVREVRLAVGTTGLNAVWTAPEQLPTAREIADPRAWVRRVHG
ncbi:MAG: zinc-dependent metalloprotease [Cellulomonas sp.]